jgi:hypothetical protein
MLVETKSGGLATSSSSYAAYKILHFGFVVLPVLAGLDKFFHFLVNWDLYLAPRIASLSPIGGHNLMLVVGVIEVVAGLVLTFLFRGRTAEATA